VGRWPARPPGGVLIESQAFERLQELKKQYDPNNVLRRNQNIPPL
jgi:FAD/FMN-containing dehydrogenase